MKTNRELIKIKLRLPIDDFELPQHFYLYIIFQPYPTSDSYNIWIVILLFVIVHKDQLEMDCYFAKNKDRIHGCGIWCEDGGVGEFRGMVEITEVEGKQ